MFSLVILAGSRKVLATATGLGSGEKAESTVSQGAGNKLTMVANSTENLAPQAQNVTNPILLASAPNTTLSALEATDDVSVVSFSFVTLPTVAEGKLTVGGEPASLGTSYSWSLASRLAFEPSIGTTSDVVFKYSVTDDEGLANEIPATFTIQIDQVPEAKNVINAKLLKTAGATQLSALSVANDNDDITYFRLISVPAAAEGVLTINGEAATINTDYPWSSSNLLVFDPAPANTANVSFAYTVQDAAGQEDASSATFTIPINKEPVTYEIRFPKVLNTATNSPLTLINFKMPVDADGVIEGVKFVSLPLSSQGVFKINNRAVVKDQLYEFNAFPTITFSPNINNLEEVVFQYVVVDNSGEDSQPANIYIPINGEPIADNVTHATAISSSAGNTQLDPLRGTDPGTSGSITKFQITRMPTPQQGILYVGTARAVANTSYNWPNASKLYFDPTYGNEANVTFSYTVVDNDGAKDSSPATYTIPIKLDFDLDGIADSDDLDDDNDGIPDALEGSDDKDQDSFINSLDLDADGDGISDVLEAHGGIAPAGYDVALARLTGAVGTNGLPNSVETSEDSGMLNYTLPNTDGDAVADFLDIDSDNDGVSDSMEAQDLSAIITRSGNDSDQDGLDDNFDGRCGCASEGSSIIPLDTDLDGLPDYLDTDSDDDGTPDEFEAHDINNSGSSIDDLKLLAESFRASASAAAMDYYAPEGETYTWLKDADGNGVTEYLQSGSEYYYDTDQDGLIDLFDTDSYDQRSINASFRDSGIITPLPVSLVSFTARTQAAGEVILNWTTASEQDNAYFIIERSLDSEEFTEISQVGGAGNSNNLLKYTFLDEQVPAGTVYYRLKQVDYSGTFEYSKVTVAKVRNTLQPRMVLYPNPANGFLRLDLGAMPAGSYKVRILSIQGRQLQEQTLEAKAVHTLNLHDLAQGKYILQIQGQQLHQTESFIKK